MKRITCLALLVAGLFGSTMALAQSGVSVIRLGSQSDATPALLGPSYYLQGDGSPQATPFQTHINQVSSTPLDITVLAASYPGSGSLTPECDALLSLANVNSCTTATLPTASGANDAAALAAVQSSEIVYFAGGNQCDYVGWRGTSVYAAVQAVVARAGGVGGGSAGLAIQGDYVYDSCTGSVDSETALRNPYARSISFTYDFFNWAPLTEVLTDSHFVERDRMGRQMSFLARQVQDGRTTAAYGIGIDDGGTLVVDREGLAQVFGATAYVVLADHVPERCKAGRSLTYSNYKLWRLMPGQTFDTAQRDQPGYYLRSVSNGRISADPY